jgi:hypothetical protein
VEHDEIVKLNMAQEWVLYFDLEQFLLELCEGGYVRLRPRDNLRFYQISAQGLDVLGLYYKRIPLSVRTSIDHYVAGNTQRLEHDMEVYADYTQNSAIDYPVVLKLNEYYKPLLSIHVDAADEASARHICKRFEELAPKLYAQLLSQLTQGLDAPVHKEPTEE